MKYAPHAACLCLGMAIAWPINASGFAPIEVAAFGIIGAALIMAIYGAYFAGLRAGEKKSNGVAHA